MPGFDTEIEGHVLHRLVEARAEAAPQAPLMLDEGGERSVTHPEGEIGDSRIPCALWLGGGITHRQPPGRFWLSPAPCAPN